MSVEQWKRVITLCTLSVIVGLIVTVIVMGVKLSGLNNTLEKETIVDLEDYKGITTDERLRLFNYFDHVDTDRQISYQKKHPELYVDNDFSFVDQKGKQCYLTFDDGPTAGITNEILDILKEQDVKATFFVIGKEGQEEEELYRRIVKEGHTIGVHTYSHDYEGIYQSVEAYLDDFDKISSHVENLTGVKPEVFRFPGGSVNGYNAEIYEELIAEMLRRGYTYHDWNIASRDTVDALEAEDILRNVAYAADETEDDIVVLMHDGRYHEATVEALPGIIKELKRQGFIFAPIDKTVTPICFGY